ncbi:MAG: flavin reductase family protein [Thauera sp.]|nr:flavin reductase family protein [Thauera sp.]
MTTYSTATTSPELFTRQLRNSFGMFATGITVVTTRTPAGEPIGITVNSFNSVSLQPPLIVWSLSLDLPSRALFENCEYYAINVLAEDQQALSERFGGRGEGDRFAGLELETGEGDVPLLSGCCARFVCRNTVRHQGGDHLVFISDVLSFERNEAREPLLYFGGRYRRLVP